MKDGADRAGAGRRGGLFVQEQFALHHLMHERAHAVVAGTGAFEHPLDFRAVAETDGGTRGIDRELLREVAGDLFFVGLKWSFFKLKLKISNEK